MKILRIPLVIVLGVVAGRAFNADAQTVTNLHLFGISLNDGTQPESGLIQSSDGNFYGMTKQGGPTGKGTLFRISPSGIFSNLHSFAGSPNDGGDPLGELVQGSDGNFYGTTTGGGTSNAGAIFRITPSGSLTNLHSFVGSPNDGADPQAGLVQGNDGNFYGTTSGGGTSNAGTIFRMSPSGSFTNLHSFAGPPNDGTDPEAGLVQGSDGNFYGTTQYGGTNNTGTVFRITPGGSETILHSFAGPPSDGAYPVAWLVEGSDGNFYGTTQDGGTSTNCFTDGCGTAFRISPSGSLTNLLSFGSSLTDGVHPDRGVVQGSDGNFYGTTPDGGTNGNGTAFRISPGGSETNLHSVGSSPSDGVNPHGGVVQGSDGNFYGMTYGGGTNNDGTVFKLTVSLSPPANQISALQFFSIFSSVGVGALIPSVAGESYQLQYTDSMSPTNWINTGGSETSIGGPMTLIDLDGVLPRQRFYRAVITP